jgi:hypothetical protein
MEQSTSSELARRLQESAKRQQITQQKANETARALRAASSESEGLVRSTSLEK